MSWWQVTHPPHTLTCFHSPVVSLTGRPSLIAMLSHVRTCRCGVMLRRKCVINMAKFTSGVSAKLANMLRHSSKKIHEVVDDLTHAVTSAHPYTRYVAALFTNQLPADIFGACPNHFQDLVLSRMLQVPALNCGNVQRKA